MTLLQEIAAEEENKTIIFAETKRKVDSITRAMRRDGWVFRPALAHSFSSLLGPKQLLLDC